MRWLFRRREVRAGLKSTLKSTSNSEVGTPLAPTKTSKDRSFTFDPIHDVESLWWLAVWSLTRHTMDADPMGRVQLSYYLDLFQARDWEKRFFFVAATRSTKLSVMEDLAALFLRTGCSSRDHIGC